jgi:hypothetical protein
MNFTIRNFTIRHASPAATGRAVSRTLGATLLVAALGFTQAVLAEQTNVVSLNTIDAAAQQLDIAGLQQQVNQAQDDYAFAYAQYRLAVTASVRADEDVMKPALGAAVDRLEQLIKSEPAADLKVEALALLALSRGLQAGYSPIKGAYYGKLSSDALEQAMALQQNNPRVQLAAAILAFQTPTLFGGSKKDALTHSDAAIAGFAQPCQQICWGQAEAYVWRGLAKADAGDKAGAKADWTQALQQAPNYGWAKQLLKDA